MMAATCLAWPLHVFRLTAAQPADGPLLTRVLLMADVDNTHKDITTKEPGCHILTLTAATLLGWPLRVLGSSLHMPGRPGVGMPNQRFPGFLLREDLDFFFDLTPDEAEPSLKQA